MSRQTYGTEVLHVEEKIKMWMTRQFNLGIAIAEEKRRVATQQGEQPVDDSVK